MDKIEIKEGNSSSDSDEDQNLQEVGEVLSSNHTDGFEERKVIEFEDEEPKKKLKKLSKNEKRRRDLARKDLNRLAMVVPDIVADREKERALLRIATIGVVQLFNAVAERQKIVEEKTIIAGKNLDKLTKQQLIEDLGSSSFHKHLEKMEKVKHESTPNDIVVSASNVLTPIKSELKDDED